MNKDLLIQELIRDEGMRLKPYMCLAGQLTIGIGRNLDEIGVTEEEALYLANNTIALIEKDLDFNLPWWRDLSDNRQRAIANMVYNLGLSRFLLFKDMIESLKQGDFESAAAEALDSKWTEQVGSRAYRIAALIREG